MMAGHKEEERNVLEQLLGTRDEDVDDEFSDDCDKKHKQRKKDLTTKMAVPIILQKDLPATVSKTKKFEDAMAHLRQKKLAAEAALETSSSRKKDLPIKISIKKFQDAPTQPKEQKIHQVIQGRVSRESAPSSSSGSCSCKHHDDQSGDEDVDDSPEHGYFSPPPKVRPPASPSPPPLEKKTHHTSTRRRVENPYPPTIHRRREEEVWPEYPSPRRHHHYSSHADRPDDDRRRRTPERIEQRGVYREERRHDSRISSSSHKSKRDPASLLKYFIKDSIFIVMKSSNHENVDLAMNEGIWSTPPQNEQKLSRAFRDFRNVILVFSVKESGRFQGFARLSSEAILDHPPVPWILPPGLAAKPFTTVFNIDWISRMDLPFSKTTHLFNPLNDDKPVKIARDGQEIESSVGQELIRLFPLDPGIDLVPLVKRMKKQTSGRPKKSRSHDSHPDADVYYERRPRVQDRLTLPLNHPRNLRIEVRTGDTNQKRRYVETSGGSYYQPSSKRHRHPDDERRHNRSHFNHEKMGPSRNFY